MKDIFNRKIDYLRISITDRCNLRCIYCMPETGVEFVEHSNILSYDEIIRVVSIASELGIRKIKITGGEPLVRKNAISLIADIKKLPLIEEVTLTTNGILLDKYLDDLYKIGIDGINVSLDAIDAEIFKKITRYDNSEEVINSIYKCVKAGIKTKVNSLIIPGINDDEVLKLVSLAKDDYINVRFIEVMPIGFGKGIKPVKPEDIMKKIESEYGVLVAYNEVLGNGPAKYYKLENFKGKIGFISAVSDCFCSECNRVRLTSTGFLKACLQYNYGINLMPLLRENYTDEDIKIAMRQIIYSKPKEHQFAGNKVEFTKDDIQAVDCGFNPKLIKTIKSLIVDDEIEKKGMSSIGG